MHNNVDVFAGPWKQYIRDRETLTIRINMLGKKSFLRPILDYNLISVLSSMYSKLFIQAYYIFRNIRSLELLKWKWLLILLVLKSTLHLRVHIPVYGYEISVEYYRGTGGFYKFNGNGFTHEPEYFPQQIIIIYFLPAN